MNIDTLNAYCSKRLVRLLCLAQGRFNIHQTCLHWALSRDTSRVALKLLSCALLCLLTLGDSLSWVGGTLRHASRGESLTRLFPAPLLLRPEIRQDYPPNLSILISGGKENNCDAPSNGE